MDGVGDAAGFAARAMDVLEAEPSDFVETILTRRHAAGHRGIALAPLVLGDQPRAFFRVAARGGRGGLDDHLDVAGVGDREHAEAETAAEVAVAGVAFAA